MSNKKKESRMDTSEKSIAFKNLNDVASSSESTQMNTESLNLVDELEEDEVSSPELQHFSLDNALEEKLKKHGLNRRNAKTIICELLNNENVRGLLQANLDKSDLPEPKQLRSKRQKNSPGKLKFTDLPLPDDDDDDEEYKPDNNIELDTTFDTEISQDTRATDFSTIDNCSNDSFMTKLHQCDSDIQAIQEKTEKEMIALRTRSKHSLLDIAMVEIESSFKPPDVSEDLYQPSGDDDWHKWLAELMMDDKITEQPGVGDDDEDPDYDFLLSDTDDQNDREDFRTGPTTHIPKQEVQVLLQERQLSTINFQGQLQAPPQTKVNVGKYPRPLTVRDQLNARRKRMAKLSRDQSASNNSNQLLSKPSTSQRADLSHKDKPVLLHFSPAQKELMRTQLCQHVQLLVQINLLSRNKPELSSVVEESKVMLEELQRLDKHDRDSFNISSSHFHIPHLPEALDLVRLNIVNSDPIVKLPKSFAKRNYLPIPRNIGVIMAISPVFAYSGILPVVAPPDAISENSRLSFSIHEDNLLVLGLAQMYDHHLPWYMLVHHYMIPTKQPDQIKTRCSNRYKCDPDNPIRKYKKTGAIPSPPDLCPPYSGPNLLESDTSVLPDWLLILQQELKKLSQEEVNLSCQQLSNIPVSVPVVVTTTSIKSSISTTIQISTSRLLKTVSDKKTSLPSVSKKKTVDLINTSSKAKRKRKARLSTKRKLTEDDEQPVCKISNPPMSETSHSVVVQPPPPQQQQQPPPPSKHSNNTIQLQPNTNPTEHLPDASVETMTNDPNSTNQTPPLPNNALLSDVNVASPTRDVSSKMEEDQTIEYDDDEAASTEDDEEEEYQMKEGADEMSEEEEVKKETEKKKKKELKVKWKNRSGSKQLGGKMHRLHPGLMGKKKSKTTEDNLTKSLRESAEKVKMLEEETIVQLDPMGVEKDILFAQGYLKRMEESLPFDVFIKVLEVMSEFDSDISQSPPSLFHKLSKILDPWPELIQGFAPFLMPIQANKCGLFAEQQVYARARKFLRQLEIRFSEQPQQLTRVLNTFKSIAETGFYREQELKNSILSLLKCDPYLQEEFLMFFDDERPPESRLHGDYEEITWSDDLLKESHLSDFEHVHIPNMGSQDTNPTPNEAVDLARSPRLNNSKSPKHHAATSSDQVEKAPVSKQDIKENGDESLDDPVLDANDNPDVRSNQEMDSFIPDVELISEDALSCSPFKRHNPPSSPLDTRPCTPKSALETTQEELSLSSQPPTQTGSSSLGSSLPVTPTGSKSSVECAERRWTFDDDNILLSACKEHGPSEKAFKEISLTLNRSEDEVHSRFQHLMSLLSGKEQTDTDTTSHYTDSESE